MNPLLRKWLFETATFVDSIKNKEVSKTFKLLERADLSSRAERINLANEAFIDLIKSISIHSEYYKNIFNKYSLNPKDFKSIDDLKKLPILTKDVIKSQRNKLISSDPYTTDYITRTSGGTTGEPIQIEVDKQCRINELYFYYRGLQWMGWKPGHPMVKFFGGSLSGSNSPTLKNKIKKYVSGEIFLPAFNLNKNTANEYLDTIKSLGPCYLQGYVSSIYTLALLTRELNYKGLKILGAFTTAEQLPIEQADFINEVFGCEVKGFYGCAEINCLGFQLETHGDYRTPEEIVCIETAKHPELEINNAFLISSLFNKRMPLLRYLNGDSGIIGVKNDQTVIQELSGRSADMFVSKSKGLISSIVATQTMQITGLTNKIKRYQLVQHSIDEIEFRYETFQGATLLDKELSKIVEMYKMRLGDEFKITPIETKDFVKSSAGKHRLMVNLY
jgi:phenylacetate-CoA ligase